MEEVDVNYREQGMAGENLRMRLLFARMASSVAVLLAFSASGNAQTVGILTVPDSGLQLASPVRTSLPSKPLPTPRVGEVIEVAVTGSVNVAGKLINIKVSASDQHRPWADALIETLPDWRFRPAFDWDVCAVKESPQSLQVWFEERQGKPVMSVSKPVGASTAIAATAPNESAKESADTARPAKRVRPAPEWDTKPSFYYPGHAVSSGIEGDVLVALMVAPNGEFKNWFVLESPDVTLSKAVISGLSLAKVKPLEPWREGAAGTCICVPLRFCLKTTPESPHTACEADRRKEDERSQTR